MMRITVPGRIPPRDGEKDRTHKESEEKMKVQALLFLLFFGLMVWGSVAPHWGVALH
jgi:hypothetical protein